MKSIELNNEPLIVPEQEGIRKEYPTQKVKKVRFHFGKIPKELRKREAARPLYLFRYE